jgi:hypothetical protein
LVAPDLLGVCETVDEDEEDDVGEATVPDRGEITGLCMDDDDGGSVVVFAMRYVA